MTRVVIDFHCHAGQGDKLTAPWNTDAPLGAYFRRARAAGIGLTVVLPAFHSNYRRANRALARIVRASHGKLAGFAMVHARRDAGSIDTLLDEAVHELGLCGVKVHGHDAMPTRELCDAARRLRLPMLLDVAGRADVLDFLLPAYPDLRVVVAHLGSFADDYRAHARVIEQLIRYPNLQADTSGVRRFDYLVEAVRRAGPRKLIFGSDGPWLHPALELHKIRLLDLSSQDEALIVEGNARRLLPARLFDRQLRAIDRDRPTGLRTRPASLTRPTPRI